MAALIVIIVIALLVGAAVAAHALWKSSHQAVGPGPQNGFLPPGPVHGQGFTPVPPTGSFKEISRTSQGIPPPAQWGTNGKTGTFGTQYINLNGICRLTGKQVADCSCDRCTQAKKKV